MSSAAAALLAGWLFAAPGAVQVVDGDTLAIGADRVRLWGVDAPERHAPGGPSATAALRDLVAGQRVVCQPLETDRYGRMVAVCLTREGDLARLMVAGMWARDWPDYSGGFYAEGEVER